MLLHRLNSGRPSYSPTTADTILHIVFKGSDRNPPLEAPWSAITRADHSRQAARAQPKGSHDLPCANLRQKAHKIIVFWDSCLSHSNDWPYFSVSNPYIEAISRTSLHFSASNPCRGAFSRTRLVFSATNPCRGAISRTTFSFSATNPCRGAISRTSLHFSATNPCRGAFSRTRLSISVCE